MTITFHGIDIDIRFRSSRLIKGSTKYLKLKYYLLLVLKLKLKLTANTNTNTNIYYI